MRLNVIEYNEVKRDLDSGVTTQFNTNFHTAEEAPNAPIPSNAPYSFGRWLPLILRTRNIPPSALQVVSLTPAHARLIILAAGASIHTRVINRTYAEDLEDEIIPALSDLVFPPEGLFVRLGACSPKDGAQMVSGMASLHTPEEVILRLTTSMRACNTLTGMLNAEVQQIELFFLPFDERMKTEREYRVFCIPETLRITAVSQYKWHKPWILADKSSGDGGREVSQAIMEGSRDIHSQIVRELKDGDVLDDLFRAQGFSFDVLYDERRQRCELIEINTFGVRSACGSCLFQWVKDRDVLYGLQSEDVEFRVAV
jgi:hypothetical protein